MSVSTSLWSLPNWWSSNICVCQYLPSDPGQGFKITGLKVLMNMFYQGIKLWKHSSADARSLNSQISDCALLPCKWTILSIGNNFCIWKADCQCVGLWIVDFKIGQRRIPLKPPTDLVGWCEACAERVIKCLHMQPFYTTHPLPESLFGWDIHRSIEKWWQKPFPVTG